MPGHCWLVAVCLISTLAQRVTGFELAVVIFHTFRVQIYHRGGQQQGHSNLGSDQYV